MNESGDDLAAGLLDRSPFDRHYGLELREVGTELVRAEVPVSPELLQPTGVVHGGVYAAIAEGVASLGTNASVHGRGRFALGLSNATNFLRPVARGTIAVAARPLHLGLTTSVWDVEMSDDEGRLCATSRVTLAIRPDPRRQGQPGSSPERAPAG